MRWRQIGAPARGKGVFPIILFVTAVYNRLTAPPGACPKDRCPATIAPPAAPPPKLLRAATKCRRLTLRRASGGATSALQSELPVGSNISSREKRSLTTHHAAQLPMPPTRRATGGWRIIEPQKRTRPQAARGLHWRGWEKRSKTVFEWRKKKKTQ